MSHFLHTIEYTSDNDDTDYSYDSEDGDSCYSDTETESDERDDYSDDDDDDDYWLEECREELIEEFMQNKFSIKQLIKICTLKSISGKKIGIIEKIKINFFITKNLKGSLSDQKHLEIYPNFYYVWREWFWLNNKLKTNSK
jgi:hypothetical protein